MYYFYCIVFHVCYTFPVYALAQYVLYNNIYVCMHVCEYLTAAVLLSVQIKCPSIHKIAIVMIGCVHARAVYYR